MQFEEQSAAIRQMKELLRDQTKFRAKLDRVVRKIETSSERTAKLAERNKARKKTMSGPKNPAADKTRDGDGTHHADGANDGEEAGQRAQQPDGAISAVPA